MSRTGGAVLAVALVLPSAGCAGFMAFATAVGNAQIANQQSQQFQPVQPQAARTPFIMACPRDAVAHVRPFHVIVQLTKPNGQPWDGPPNELRRLGCPSFLVSPGATVRGLVGLNVGAAGDAALDLMADRAIDVHTGGLVTACGRLNSAQNITQALLAPFDAPDVFLVYGTSLGKSFRSNVIENARPADLTRVDRGLRPLAIPCAFGDTSITVSATDRDRVGQILTLGLVNGDDPIGEIRTSLAELRPEAICRGYAYVAADETSGPVAIGLRIDPPDGSDCSWMSVGEQGDTTGGGAGVGMNQ